MPSTDNVGVAGYQIYRNGALLRTTPSTSFTDSALTPLTSYSYRVAAYDYSNNLSASSAVLDVTTASPGPTLEQQSYSSPQTPQSVVAAAYVDGQVAGNTNILAIGWNDTVASIVSVGDGAGNVYHSAIATVRGNGISQAIYYASDIHAASPGANQVSVTFDRAAAFVDLRITEYSGLRQTNPFDAGASASGIGTAAGSGTLVTADAGELLFAAGMTSAAFTAPGSGFTREVITSPDGDLVEDGVAASAGSQAATATSSSGSWLLQLAAFVPAG
jgi:chitodextrinase